jgi:hypothetical protein
MRIVWNRQGPVATSQNHSLPEFLGFSMREMIIAPLHPARTGPGVDRGMVVCAGTPSTSDLRRPVHRESKALTR